MTMVLDSSAILAFLLDEAGGDVVETALQEGACCGAANWSEITQKILAAGRNWHLVSALLTSFGVEVVPVVRGDAEWAAQRWRPLEGLSLADRLCLALGERLDATVITADRAWGTTGRITQIR